MTEKKVFRSTDMWNKQNSAALSQVLFIYAFLSPEDEK